MELINEINAVRNKYDAFSQFTEMKVAEIVLKRKSMAMQLEQMSRDLAVTNAQRAQLHAELVTLTARVDGLKMQRDKARSRVKFLEASRSYRIEQKLRRIVSRLLLRK